MSDFAPRSDLLSWGRVQRPRQFVASPSTQGEIGDLLQRRDFANGLLPRGLGRSYGDSNLNAEGGLIDGRSLDRILGFDPETGLLTAQGGVSLEAIVAFALPRGFFLPVTPGTKFATLGGAIANDVHGKNHHVAGTFGRWVEAIELWRSDGVRRDLSPRDPLFAATVGGLGLTGFVAQATIRLRRVASAAMDIETIPFGDLDAFFALSRASEASHEYAVAWVDCLASGRSLGRGILTRANHAVEDDGVEPAAPRRRVRMPFETPGALLNRFTIGAMNNAYHALGRMKAGHRRVAFDPFFFPLDGIGDWNRLYGRRGMFQFQSVVPSAAGPDAITAMLREIAEAGQGSFLAVLKTFGPLASPGLLSFPREGATLALDFPNKGESTLKLLGRLDAIVAQAGGRLYPAKDGRMPAELFAAGYPALGAFKRHLDPALSSSFWRRMTAGV